MSYDISLYDRAFLRRALEEGLGDWTIADEIPPATRDGVVARAKEAGFQPGPPPDPSFVEFMRARGLEPSVEYVLDTPEAFAQLSIHDNQIAFTIPYSDRATAAIELCTRVGRAAAAELGLGLHDPQEGIEAD
jgi:hypothetical protein